MNKNTQNTTTAITTATSRAPKGKAPGITKQRLEYNGIPFIQKDLPVADLELSIEVKNFKKDADPITGIVDEQRLTGNYERLGTAAIVVWKRKNGALVVITGRHRLFLAKENGEQTIPCHVIKEKKGFTAEMARSFDAYSNIRDSQGTIKDYVEFFKISTITKDEAISRGLLSRKMGKNAWAIAKLLGAEAFAVWSDRKINADQAAAIALAAPNHNDQQRAVLKHAIRGDSPAVLKRTLERIIQRAGIVIKANKGTQIEFAYDDSWVDECREESVVVEQKIDEINKVIRATEYAANNPERAAIGGVVVTNPNESLRIIENMKTERQRWDEYTKHSDLVAFVDAELKSDPLCRKAMHVMIDLITKNTDHLN